jgi:cytosine/adenosine deaminase-related metal-dependent hydrolase
MAYRREAFGADATLKAAAIAAGWRESAAAGTTLVGEIATDGWSLDSTDASGPRVVAFRELIGLRAETVARQEAIAEDWLTRLSGTSNIVAALSPHAPYSVSLSLMAHVVLLAKERGHAVAMHLAETQSELEFLASGRGELAEMLRGFGAMPSQGLPIGLRPLDYLRALSISPRALIVHGNYLVEDEIDFLAARPQMSVVYCPRTHAYFGHEPHPWRRLLAKGINVAVGTDGRGSNPDLSIWNELTFLRDRFADVAPQTLLMMGTLAGARALGFAHDCGSLTPGKRADLIVVSLPGFTTTNDPHELLFVEEQQILETRFGPNHEPEV